MKFRITLKSFNNSVILEASEQLRLTLMTTTNSQVNGCISLPPKIKRFCVLRSPHIDKDSREHFEIRFFKCFFDFSTDSYSILDLLLKTELPVGVFCSFKILEE